MIISGRTGLRCSNHTAVLSKPFFPHCQKAEYRHPAGQNPALRGHQIRPRGPCVAFAQKNDPGSLPLGHRNPFFFTARKQVPISKSAIAKLQSFSNDTSQIKKVAPTQITQINQDEYVASNINASKRVNQTRKIK